MLYFISERPLLHLQLLRHCFNTLQVGWLNLKLRKPSNSIDYLFIYLFLLSESAWLLGLHLLSILSGLEYTESVNLGWHLWNSFVWEKKKSDWITIVKNNSILKWKSTTEFLQMEQSSDVMFLLLSRLLQACSHQVSANLLAVWWFSFHIWPFL